MTRLLGRFGRRVANRAEDEDHPSRSSALLSMVWRTPSPRVLALACAAACLLLVMRSVMSSRARGPHTDFFSPPPPLLDAASAAAAAACPFANVDVLVILDAGSMPLASFLFNSLTTFMPCFNTLHLIVEPELVPSLPAWISAPLRAHNVAVHSLIGGPFAEAWRRISAAVVPERRGYVMQAYVGLFADTFVNASGSRADFLMFLDTDSILGLPVTCAALFDDVGRVRLAYFELEAAAQFFRQCRHFVGTCVGTFMAFFPFTVPLVTFEPMRAHFLAHARSATAAGALPPASFADALLDYVSSPSWGGPADMSQFNLMGNWLAQHAHGSVKAIECLKFVNNRCLDFVPVAGHYWEYSIYTESTLLPRKGERQGERYSPKWNSVFIDEMTALQWHGLCLMRKWYNGTRGGRGRGGAEGGGGGSLAGALVHACDPALLRSLPPHLVVYKKEPPDMAAVELVFGPQGMAPLYQGLCAPAPRRDA